MQYSMGIDAGGTYTDSVIVRDSDGKIVDSSKARTTYPDLLEGIRNSIDGLDKSYLENIKLVSVSTTLSTNTILEHTGYPVALILIGDLSIPEGQSIENYIAVSGGHGAYGEEAARLDIDSVREFVLKMKDRVSAFAVSSYFSIRNPGHELEVKALIRELTGLPVVCGHELSQDLGAFSRGITAYLNAQLIPITDHFIDAIMHEMDRRKIHGRLLMLKCDGSVVGIDEAKEKPIESIFSGPAASLVGASYLSDVQTCVAIDVGGTSTDVAMVNSGLPEITDEGAIVGGWQTKVKAIRMETSAMGGDSHIWVQNQKINIGPRRVIPICVAATKWPGIKDKLKVARIPSKMQLCENIQPTKFFIRTGKESGELSPTEQDLLDRIGDEPVSVNEIYSDHLPSPVFLDLLIKKRLIQAIGFTPTDALHVLGDYTEWDVEASRLAAGPLGRMTYKERTEFCKEAKTIFAKNMALYIMAYLLRGIDKEEIEKILENRDDFYSAFKLSVPVVLLGGPVQAYVEEINKFFDADVILPEHAEVGNAVGALVGKGIKRIEILIRNVYKGRKSGIMMFSPHGREAIKYATYPDALEAANTLGREMIMEYMKSSGLDGGDVRIEVTQNDIKLQDGGGIPIETKLTFVGVGMPRLDN
ncbi:N-methylhydantoinase A/oxoprolinase/acetone carboxylase beta subunit [Methanohalophilus levihalophilus]|uniref:hydantoinase/oxoprolinase family protein n=1 Tax=Methanohalophilus levihalophilus TaxID=1431282 RepID=UPI001AE5C4AC|nr:hydantoinase/oxoprolinase family protein [Methanohalophilus levihalophilus]MBP2029545.1 N-methylhydantoinase A/oxoprolinase/acetone carboxylase beta subunit [Methanohalophilus levihalophilus]